MAYGVAKSTSSGSEISILAPSRQDPFRNWPPGLMEAETKVEGKGDFGQAIPNFVCFGHFLRKIIRRGRVRGLFRNRARHIDTSTQIFSPAKDTSRPCARPVHRCAHY
jgi:hypothetical protein